MIKKLASILSLSVLWCSQASALISEQQIFCGSSLSDDQYLELLELTNPNSFESYHEAPQRTARIAEIFGEAGDRRGIFSSMYVVITEESHRSTMDGVYEQQHIAEQLVYRFAYRYLDAYHKHLTGETPDPKWDAYFQVASDCNNSELYVLGAGVNTHLTYDLPMTLLDIGADLDFKKDFMEFGNVLINKTRESADLTLAQQGFDPYPFFNGFIFGQAIDAVAGHQTTAHFVFQKVRGDAWNDFARAYRENESSRSMRAITGRWQSRHFLLRFMPPPAS